MNATVAFSLIVLAALLLEPVTKRLHLPQSAVLVLGGFLGSELLVGLGIDTGLRWYHFSDLILLVFLPALVFEDAFNTDVRDLLRCLLIVLFLAVPMLLAASLVIGTLLYFGIGHPVGFPLVTAVLAGALLSASDPVAIVSAFKRVDVPARLQSIVKGEALFNDAAAIVLFSLLVSLATTHQGEIDPAAAIGGFLWIFFGGIGLGALLGALGVGLLRLLRQDTASAALTITVAVMCMYLGEYVLHVSGIIAVLCSGLLMGMGNRRLRQSAFPGALWEFIAFVAQALIFVLVGVTITSGMFEANWLAMLIGIAAVLFTRAALVYSTLPPLSWMKLTAPIPVKECTVIALGGMQGATALALALSLPTALESWFTVQSIAYGVVLFVIFIQAPVMESLLRRLFGPKLTMDTPA